MLVPLVGTVNENKIKHTTNRAVSRQHTFPIRAVLLSEHQGVARHGSPTPAVVSNMLDADGKGV